MTKEKKPRSIRLTQARRADMVTSVMDEWSKQNKEPENPFLNFFRSLVKKQLKTKAKRPADNTFAAIAATHNKIANVLATIPDADALLSPGTQQYLHLFVQDEDGREVNTWGFEIPASLAFDLGLPHRAAPDHYPHLGPLGGVLTDDDKTESGATLLASFYSPKELTVLIKVSDPLYREYKKNVRKQNAYAAEKEKVKNELEDFLSRFNTTNQIREGWPEMVQYLPTHLADPEAVIRLPQLAVSRLNERLGLGN